ncbi:energy transducer TonB [Pedobacter xixiisoli]|uniref:Protein TonB n=1 Tax=Pedobacter xixiisoli TaxID=1476464 RepID=A0A285ZPZ0_9SPHI|nr:energy transducer TonB [Pedobacter xixiisoli]SOD11698.1 protein TonB [Pedobacter xixiisoli]
MFNKSSNLYGGEWLALVFANRNQQYGAYELRKQSSNTLLKAFLIAAPIFVSAFVGPSIVAAFKGDKVVIDDQVTTIVNFDNKIHEIVKPKPEEAKPAEAKAQEEVAPKVIAPKVKTVGLTDNIKVVKDDLVTLQPPTSDEIKDAVIGSKTQDGLAGKGNADLGSGVAGPGEGIGAGGNGTGGNDVKDLSGVDVYPEFPGGMEGWAKYIQRNLRYPSMAQDEGIGGKVFLSFVVEKDGTITDVKVTRGIGYGLDEEAMRVIKKSPRWKAGMQNNLPVRVRYNMPINYTISN